MTAGGWPPALLAGICVAAVLVDLVDARVEHVRARVSSAPRAGARRTTRLRSLVAALGQVGRRAGLPLPAPGDLGRRVQAAGLPTTVTVADVMAVKAGAALCAAVVAVLGVLPSAPGRGGILLVLALPSGAFLIPDWWLRRCARERARRLAADLPDVLDLTRVAVAAGLPLVRALEAVGTLRGGPLAAELRVSARLLELGQPRAHVYARLAERCPLPGVLALVAAIGRSERHGTPLASALAALAADARADRARRTQDRAARAAPKIQLAVALLLVPAAMLVLAAGLLTGVPT